MLLTVEQIKQVYALLQEHPTATHVSIVDKVNGSGIGPDTDAVFIRWPNVFKSPETLETANITDVSLW